MPDVRREGPTALLLCMMGIVACNVRFVQLTEAADPLWLAMLYVVTLAAPFLLRFRESLLYRSAWNVGIVLFFLRLVQHASTAELEFVLDDGLLLALLCQVHVLNNLREEQRPDLLFLNSFLIAVITGYITVDMSFAVTFLVYAPLFVLGLQLRTVERFGLAGRRTATRAIVWDSARRSLGLVAVTLLAFFFFPRDFNRPALFADAFDLDGGGSSYQVGFTETLDLGSVDRQAAESDQVVLRIELLDGEAATLPRLWRGVTLAEHRAGGSWSVLRRAIPANSPLRDPAWEHRWEGLRLVRAGAEADWEEAPDRGMSRVRVTRAGGVQQRLFLPREAYSVDLDPIHTAGELVTASDGTAHYSNPGELRYEVRLGREPEVPDPRRSIALEREPFVGLTHTLHTQSARALARELARRLPEGADGLDQAHEFARYLAERYPYRLPGADGAARTLDEFLGTEKGGHCEMFASALATMLRARGVPSRVVSGYAVSGLRPGDRVALVRSRDAHAWVEVYDEATGGWRAVDPTPQLEEAAAASGWFGGALESMEATWASLTRFDAGTRSGVLRSLMDAPAALLRVGESGLAWGLTLGVLAALLVVQRRRRPAGPPPAVLSLNAAFERAGLTLRANETPREGLERAAAAELAPELSGALHAAVDEHERARYARSGQAIA